MVVACWACAAVRMVNISIVMREEREGERGMAEAGGGVKVRSWWHFGVFEC